MSGRRLTGPRGDRRGAVLPFVCVLLTVLLGFGALAVDLGRLYAVGQQVQTAADAAALAAMRAKQYLPLDYGANAVTNAQAAARDAAARNATADAATTVAAVDVVPVAYDPATRVVSSATWTTNTSAIRVTAQAHPSYLLAGALGLTAPVVRRSATAWLASLSGGDCIRPLSINYTRFYEEGVTWDNRYTSRGQLAPDFDQWDVSNTRLAPLQRRTFTFLPPDTSETAWDAKGYQVHGNWRPALLGTGAGGALNAFTAQLAAPEGGPGCAAARAVRGDIKPPLVASPTALLNAANAGMAGLCHRYAGSTSAWCLNTRSTVGVKARILSSDSIPLAGGGFVLRVREVGVVRIMCYFRASTDQCGPVTMTEREASGVWQPMGPSTGYPPGTMMVLIDSPGSTDITRDVVLSSTPGLTQRVLLAQ